MVLYLQPLIGNLFTDTVYMCHSLFYFHMHDYSVTLLECLFIFV